MIITDKAQHIMVIIAILILNKQSNRKLKEEEKDAPKWELISSSQITRAIELIRKKTAFEENERVSVIHE